MKFFFPFLFLLTLLSFSFAEHPEIKIDRKQIQEPISKGQSLRIENPFGDVRLRSGEDATFIDVYGVIQNLEAKTPAPEIKTFRENSQLTVQVHSTQTKGSLDRTDLVVYVPDGIKTFVKTLHGLIEVKGITGDVQAISERGEIVIRSVKGHLQAENQSGSILVELLPEVTILPQDFQTRTGEISLYLWEGFGANVHLETSGEITTDFSIEIDYRASKEPDKIATAKIGNRNGTISARSKQGKISLLRLIKKLPQAIAE